MQLPTRPAPCLLADTDDYREWSDADVDSIDGAHQVCVGLTPATLQSAVCYVCAICAAVGKRAHFGHINRNNVEQLSVCPRPLS